MHSFALWSFVIIMFQLKKQTSFKNESDSQVRCFCEIEPVGAVAAGGVFWWFEAHGAVDRDQVIIHTVKIVVAYKVIIQAHKLLLNARVVFVCQLPKMFFTYSVSLWEQS